MNIISIYWFIFSACVMRPLNKNIWGSGYWIMQWAHPLLWCTPILQTSDATSTSPCTVSGAVLKLVVGVLVGIQRKLKMFYTLDKF